MEQTLIKLQNLSKVYGKAAAITTALSQIDLSIVGGEFIAIMGSSGSGKSTLMHILGLLDRPSSGEYSLDENLVSHLSDNQLAALRNKKMGFVFQSFNLLARTTVLENVALPLIYRGVSTAQRRQLAKAALTKVNLAHKLLSLPNELSGGEQQRVAIARALVTDPQIIFADEPTGNLDSKNSLEVMDIFTQLNAAGKTIILVTHEDDIAEFANRLIKLQDGLLVSDSAQNNF
ncbi:ABC transporter ATP-binding protein [Patescibacteria group bacterium]|nr:ABC transporter ATP-binding protein [Patescibacteria group bacterium]